MLDVTFGRWVGGGATSPGGGGTSHSGGGTSPGGGGTSPRPPPARLHIKRYITKRPLRRGFSMIL